MSQQRFRLKLGRRPGKQQSQSKDTRSTALIQGTNQVQFNDGNFTVVGGDSHTHCIHHHGPGATMTLELILRAIPNFRKIHQDMLAKAAPGTGMWLLKSERFSLWLEPNGDLKILWGSGIPGAGKTIIAALVIDMLEAMARVSGAKTCIAYIYFRYSERAEMTVRSVLEVFVKQMVERHPDALPIVRKVYAQHLSDGTYPTQSQLLGLLQHLTDYVATIFVLDALDEAPTEIQVDLVRSLASLNCKMLITSRPLSVVEEQLPSLHRFLIAAQEGDIDLLIKQKLERNTYLRGLLAQADTSLREEIISTIKRRSGGMFLHASLQLDALCHCLSIHDVQETIEQFPSEIEDAYGQTWRRILNQHQRHVSLAKSVMLWVVNAARSMSIEELRRAVATRPDNHKFEPARMVPEATLLGLCHGLVVLEEESRLVRLVHYTARKPVEALLLEFFPHPHRLFTAVCITHLTDCGFQNTTIDSEERLKQALDDDPLLAYSHDAWACHAQLSLDDKILVTQLTTFLEDCQAFPALIYHRFDRVTALHLVAFYKLPFSFAGSLDDLNLNLRTEVGGYTPMGLACLRGHQTGVQALLSLPGSVNTVDRAGYSPLMYAAFKGYDGIVRLLLACPDIQVNLVNLSGASALLHAAFNGDHTTFELLLARPEIQVSRKDKYGSSALAVAAGRGHDRIVKLLLDRPEIDANAADSHGSTALLLASQFGHVKTVELLIAASGFDPNQRDRDGDTAVKMAAKYGHEAIVRTLLKIPGIDITIASTTDGHTAMSAALANGHDAVVQLLLDFNSRSLNQLAGGTKAIEQLSKDMEEGWTGDSDTDDDELFEDALDTF